MADLIIATMLPADGFCGVQTHFQAIAAAARNEGHSVSVITPHGASAWRRRATNAVGRALRPASREAATLWGKAALAFHLRGRLAMALRSACGMTTVYAQDPQSAEVALGLRGARAFRLATVVHYNFSEANECADNGLTTPGGRLWRSLSRREARILPRVDKLLFVSDFMRRIVTERVPETRQVDVEVIPNFPARSDGDREGAGDAGDLISIGTLEPRKNQVFLLRVLASAAARGHRFRLTLVGDGPGRSELEREAARLGVRDVVTFLGYVPFAAGRITSHRAYAHAAVVENLPMALLEAMQRATPILAPAVGGIPELVDDGVEGRLWPLDDPDRAAEILVECLGDEARRAAMGRAGRRRFEERYDVKVLGPRWVTAILGRPRPAS